MDDKEGNYILSHITPEPEHLASLRREVNLKLLYPRMCSGHLQGRVLSMLTSMIAPKRVLEVGTYAGYSALCIAEALPPDGVLDTVEIDDEMESFIRRQFAASEHGKKIRLHIGDIADIISRLDGHYDMVYFDGNKRTYLNTLNLLRPLVRPGGFIIADNTLWSGKVTDTETNHDPQTLGIAEFNSAVASDTSLEKVILPLRDGLTIVRLKP